MTTGELLQAESFKDRISTVTASGKRNWVFASKPSGRYYNIRNVFAFSYLFIFFTLPFIKINEMPFIMLNILDGKFILFSKIFWPQDFFIFALGMIVFIFFIAIFTMVYGRLFCGWMCPQTFFLEFIFRKIEWVIEGSSTQQKKLNEHKNINYFVRKTTKHITFLIISFLITNTFFAYIVGVDKLFEIIREPIIEHLNLLAGILLFTFIFYAVFAFVREIVCTTICPYGRLQGVLVDKQTMQISYDFKRGEPREKVSKDKHRTGGDCIDCKLCVQVCPTGIDIRNGVQMECVGCTACIDACDNIMDKLKTPRGLIRYASENEILNQEKFKFNGRVKAYTAILVILLTILLFLLGSMRPIDTYVNKVKGLLYNEINAYTLCNFYEAKIINKTNREQEVTLRLEGKKGEIKLIGNKKIVLKKESVNEVIFFIAIPKTNIKERKSKIQIGIYQGEEKIQTINTVFLGPFS